MFRKTCSRCGKDSFSAAWQGKWLCPYCNKDLAKEKLADSLAKKDGREQSTGRDERSSTEE